VAISLGSLVCGEEGRLSNVRLCVCVFLYPLARSMAQRVFCADELVLFPRCGYNTHV
jgi:hypothetical protein